MKPYLLLSLLSAGCLSFSTFQARAAEDHPVRIRHAVEVEFQAEAGHYYRLQRSTNMVHWEDVEDSVYGHGGREDRLLSARNDDRATQEFFRLVVTDAPTNGLAPWSLAGLSLNLDDAAGGDPMRFLTATNGVDGGSAPDPFQYVYTLLGTNQAKAEIVYTAERRDELVLTFTSATMGTWTRHEFRKNRLKDRQVGVFQVVSSEGNPTQGGNGSTTTPPPPAPAEIPSSLTGLAYSFQSGEVPTRLVFNSATGGKETGDDINDNEPNLFTYTYAVTGATAASLVVRLKADRWHEYDLTFTGPGNRGTFVRREYDRNALKDTDTGTFAGSTIAP